MGLHTIRELLHHGYKVLSLDLIPLREELCDSRICDLRRSGDLYEACKRAHAVVHLGAYQAPNLTSDCETFSNNLTATYTVLKAATDMDVRRVVLASSVAAYGFTYAPKMWTPDYLPLDEAYPCKPQDPYALSKVFGEQLADSFALHSAIDVVSLRFSGINFDLSYRSLPERWRNPTLLMGSFWSYVDARDAAVACRLAIEADIKGHAVFNIAARTSRMREPTEELISRYLPGLKQIKEGFSGTWGGLNATKAEESLGFKAEHVWQKYLKPDGTPYMS